MFVAFSCSSVSYSFNPTSCSTGVTGEQVLAEQFGIPALCKGEFPGSQHRLLAVPPGSRGCPPGQGLESSVPAGAGSTTSCLCGPARSGQHHLGTPRSLLVAEGRCLMRINRLQPGRVRVAAGMRGVRQGQGDDAPCLGLLNVVQNPSGAAPCSAPHGFAS